MRPTGHLIASITISSISFKLTHSGQFFLVSFLAGILIDIDHFIDYLFYCKNINFNLRNFYLTIINLKLRKYFLIWHSFEFIVFLWVIKLLWINSLLYTAFLLGITQHLTLDIIYNSPKFSNKVLFYSFIYRFNKSFEKNNLFLNNA